MLHSLPFKLEVDATAVGAWTVLQEDNRGSNQLSYFSRKFSKHQLNYYTTEKEALALPFTLQHFELYLRSSVKPIKFFLRW